MESNTKWLGVSLAIGGFSFILGVIAVAIVDQVGLLNQVWLFIFLGISLAGGGAAVLFLGATGIDSWARDFDIKKALN